MSKEIAELDPFADWVEITSDMDMTLIFNIHATPEDADNTTEHIEPHSVVFIEGYNMSDHEATIYEDVFTGLLETRIAHGANSQEYADCKQMILSHFQSILYRPARYPADFNQHRTRGIINLLEKDCVVVSGDYTRPPDHWLAEERDHPLRAFHTFVRDSDLDLALVEDNPAKCIRVMQKVIEAEYNMHQTREAFARMRVPLFRGIVDVFENEYDRKADFRNSDGRIRAYMTYGSAHQLSLTQSMQQVFRGRLDIKVVTKAEEYAMISPDKASFERTRHRKLAVVAFTFGLGHTFTNEEYDEILQRVYDGSSDLLDNDGRETDALRGFVINMIALRQSIKHVYEEYELHNTARSLINPYFADMIPFVPPAGGEE